MTLFFAATTAACLIILAVFTAHQDSQARGRVDTRLESQAHQIALGLDIDEDGLIYSSAPPSSQNLDQPLGLTAIGTSPAAVVVHDRVEYSSPARSALPVKAVIDGLVRAAAKSQAALTTAPAESGPSARWVAVPVREGAAAVVILGDRSGPPGTHTTVVIGLAAAVAGLIAATTFAGHLMSGVAMRPAVRSTQQQEQFLREAAHELRTPLATLSLIAEAGIRDPATSGDALAAVHQRLGRLNLLVGNLLARAHAEVHGTEVARRALRLDQLVEVTVDDLNIGNRIILNTTATVVIGNRELLTQAVRNLIENALRHAPTSMILVTVQRNCVTVDDEGRSRDPQESQSRTEQSGRGTGTGLTIVRWVADVHGAEFTLAPSNRGGLIATLTFPRTA